MKRYILHCLISGAVLVPGVASAGDRCIGSVVQEHCYGTIMPDYANPHGHPSGHFDEKGRGLHDTERPGVYQDGWKTHFNLTPRYVPGHGLRYYD